MGISSPIDAKSATYSCDTTNSLQRRISQYTYIYNIVPELEIARYRKV